MGTVVGVVGTGLIAMFFMQLQNLRDDLRQGLRDLGQAVAVQGESIESLKIAVVQLETAVVQLETTVVQLNETAKDHGKRLARIEHKLDSDPPAEAA